MLIDLIKFIHLLITLSLLGLTFHCVTTKDTLNLKRINITLFCLGVFAILTGTLLVYPKHFTFHTPWIQAAYVLVVSFCLCVGAMIFFPQKSYTRKSFLRGVYFILLMLLVVVIHDAVTKTTFIT
jgi:uncharacterized membrane protein YozB (DUF420 family)